MSRSPSALTEDIDRTTAAPTLAGDASVDEHPDEARRTRALTRGSMVGRYIVLELLGRGGMGVVHAAYDPELDRKVALKLMLPGRDRGGAARLRLQREAQAIARLSHPNVVGVYDVGTVDQQVFIAMEFIDGMDMSRWLSTGEHGQAEILDRFLQAGAGLAAAHAADLVHRDFKPENVLVGNDGRARVVDFGLVRKDDALCSSSTNVEDELALEVSQRRAAHGQELQLTAVGSLLGTPAYMSPEQFHGGAGDARSDQFSFCVALYLALYGERPFAGSNPAELSYSVTQGEVRPPPAEHRVSSRLRRVLLRGLASEPDQRYPHMEALLAALRRAAAPRRWPWAVLGVALVSGGLGAWMLDANEERPCAGLVDRAAVIWRPERRQQLREHFDRTELSFAADTWARVERRLDDDLRDWTRLQLEICEDGQALDPRAAADDPRQRCLDERLAAIDNLLTMLDGADQRMVTNAVRLTHGLAEMGACAQPDVYLLAPQPNDPEQRTRVQELRAELERWSQRTSVELDDEGIAQLQSLVERAEALGYGPLLVELMRAQSDLASARGELERSLELENRAFELGLASRHDLAALRAASGLVYIHGVTRRELEPAEAWARRADALHRRIGGVGHVRVPTLNALASSYALAGRDEQARALYEQALAIVDQSDDPILRATLLNNMGAFNAERRRLGPAREYLEQAAVLNDELYGPSHPSSLRTRANLGIVTVMDGQYAEGQQMLESILPRQQELIGPDHPDIANTLESLASACARTGDPVRTEQLRRRVLEIRSRVFGPRSTPVVMAKTNLANALIFNDEHAEARALLLELVDVEIGARQRLLMLQSLALATAEVGPLDEALTIAEQAQQLCDQGDHCDEQTRSEILTTLGSIRLGLGDSTKAQAAFEAALKVPDSSFNPWTLPMARFGLAKALVDDDRERALGLAKRAWEDTEGRPDSGSKRLHTSIDAWLKAPGAEQPQGLQ
ncbi:tetratricopeptide repeat protein [Paraliomyxa miuraensis]|uniref:tetratricopeptide repeat protein n=1 Tax=Paraliomyxa miuraensis TaxID=376150 RepID=UPI002257C0F8|nr:tetratricopeptide repeat protein [Paraliomyxa miuraensis]MCX4240647.1 tetratricopeptide repeat protein [Paraliomyxa miuraensis]